MKINQEGIELIKHYEGLRLNAYKCSANVSTIGYGTTVYPDGRRVRLGDRIDARVAHNLLMKDIARFEKEVLSLLKVDLNENQFSALICFAYNVGSDIDKDNIAEGLGDSTLLKLVNKNPNDPAIRGEFMKWNKAGVKILKGLTDRRNAEANLYFKPVK